MSGDKAVVRVFCRECGTVLARVVQRPAGPVLIYDQRDTYADPDTVLRSRGETGVHFGTRREEVPYRVPGRSGSWVLDLSHTHPGTGPVEVSLRPYDSAFRLAVERGQRRRECQRVNLDPQG